MSGEDLAVDITLERGDFRLATRFTAPPGITILFGPSGSGKSSTLAAIAGLLRPDRGQVKVGADAWFDSATKVNIPVHRRGAAMVFQSLALFPHMNALGNVMYGMDRARREDERVERARELLARFGVEHLAERRPKTFSGGEAQRVALARALGMSPRVVLLDEPFSAVDHALRRALCAELRESSARLAVPFIHVTHHLGEARWLGDRVVCFEQGRVVAIKSPEELPRRQDDD